MLYMIFLVWPRTGSNPPDINQFPLLEPKKNYEQERTLNMKALQNT